MFVPTKSVCSQPPCRDLTRFALKTQNVCVWSLLDRPSRTRQSIVAQQLDDGDFDSILNDPEVASKITLTKEVDSDDEVFKPKPNGDESKLSSDDEPSDDEPSDEARKSVKRNAHGQSVAKVAASKSRMKEGDPLHDMNVLRRENQLQMAQLIALACSALKKRKIQFVTKGEMGGFTCTKFDYYSGKLFKGRKYCQLRRELRWAGFIEDPANPSIHWRSNPYSDDMQFTFWHPKFIKGNDDDIAAIVMATKKFRKQADAASKAATKKMRDE